MVEKDFTFQRATGLGSLAATHEAGAAQVLAPLSSEMIATDMFGHFTPSAQNTLTLGPTGPMLLSDLPFLFQQQQFDRERIPPRAVHPKGVGCHGVFRVTDSSVISKYCCSKVFNTTGKETPVFTRFSTVTTDKGWPDTLRDQAGRGFAVKFYCQDPGDGIMDWVFINSPVFFTRDPMKAPSVIHVNRTDPQTGLRRESWPKQRDAFWDLISLSPESLHATMYNFGDRGLPLSYRHMHGYGNHSFKSRNANGEVFFLKFRIKSRLGYKTMTPEEGKRIAMEDPDYHGRDLYEAIERGEFPSYDILVQPMSMQQAIGFQARYGFYPFEITKVWPKEDFPEFKFGELVLNRNPKNFFAEVEQVAYGPGNLPPGLEVNPHDRMFVARAWWYRDTQLHRIGPNYHLVPVNNGSINGLDKSVLVNDVIARDGPMNVSSNYGLTQNYFPNSLEMPILDAQTLRDPVAYRAEDFLLLGEEIGGTTQMQPNALRICRTDIYGERTQYPHTMIFGPENADDVDFIQPRMMWRKIWNEEQRQRFVRVMAGELRGITKDTIRMRMLNAWNKVDPDLGARLLRELGIPQLQPSGIGQEAFMKMTSGMMGTGAAGMGQKILQKGTQVLKDVLGVGQHQQQTSTGSTTF